MDERISLEPLDKDGIAWAQETVTKYHYLRRPVDSRTSVEGYAVYLEGVPGRVGLFLVGRPEATRCFALPDWYLNQTDAERAAYERAGKPVPIGWYGDVADKIAGRCECSRWEILNLSRVWLDPKVQAGGEYFHPRYIPSFEDRHGVVRPCLASEAIKALMARVGYDYLVRRPPCFLQEPYQCSFLLSYCDTSQHKGTIYAASGFELYRTNERGIQTWRVKLPGLTTEQDERVRYASRVSPRSNKYRAKQAQLTFQI